MSTIKGNVSSSNPEAKKLKAPTAAYISKSPVASMRSISHTLVNPTMKMLTKPMYLLPNRAIQNQIGLDY